MKRKLLYIFFITVLLVLPVGCWLYFFWNVKNFTAIPSFSKLKYIYSQDFELKILTIINGSLYLISLIKVLSLKSKKNVKYVEKSVLTETKENVKSIPSNDWSKLYDNKQKINITKPEQTVEKENAMQENNVEIQKNIEIKKETEKPKIEIKPIEVYKKEIEAQMERIGYTMLSGCKVNGIELDFIAVADNDTLVIGIINMISENITANETTAIEGMIPSWFSIDEKFDSPVVKIKQAKDDIYKLIREVLPEDTVVNIYPVVVFPVANIVNYNELKDVWEQDNVNVTRVFSNSVVPAVVDVIPDKTGKTVLESYKDFILTVIKYFQKK